MHDVKGSDHINMGKFDGGFITLDTCNTAMKLGRELRAKIEEAVAELYIDSTTVNDQEMKTEIEPCQHHQRNVCLDGISNEISKY